MSSAQLTGLVFEKNRWPPVELNQGEIVHFRNFRPGNTLEIAGTSGGQPFSGHGSV